MIMWCVKTNAKKRESKRIKLITKEEDIKYMRVGTK